MHLGNGAITPECGIVALGAAAAGAGIAWASARAWGLDRAQARTAGALGAAVFAAQLFNVQVLPFSSVHLIGGVLLAWILGPPLGLLTMASVLALEALLLGDGGLLALGANLLNMGVLPAVAVACVKRWTVESGPLPRAAVLFGTALACTLGGALMIVLEVSVGRSSAELEGLGAFASQMLWTHALAGVLEGAYTVAIVGVLVGFGRQDVLSLRFSPARAAAVLAASFAVALVSVPSLGLSSHLPDGYEAALAVVGESGQALARIEAAEQLAGVGAAAQSWQDAIVSTFAGPQVLLLVLSTLAAGAAAWTCARACAKESWQPVR